MFRKGTLERAECLKSLLDKYIKGYTEIQLRMECKANIPEESQTSYKSVMRSYSSLIDKTRAELDQIYVYSPFWYTDDNNHKTLFEISTN